MPSKNRFLLPISVAALAVLTGYALTEPAVAVCALMQAQGLQPTVSGALMEQGHSTQDQEAADLLVIQARARIAHVFGQTPRAQPIVAFYQNQKTFGPFKLNAYASTTFVGNRTCGVVGPNGHNIDVVSHELMHAELAQRTGIWRRFFYIPTWFDEGLAMQVDFRPAYELPTGRPIDTSHVMLLDNTKKFFAGDDAQLTLNYAYAKAQVAQWLTQVGSSSLYQRLQRLHDGENFTSISAQYSHRNSKFGLIVQDKTFSMRQKAQQYPRYGEHF
jgi:hypothetical protein